MTDPSAPPGRLDLAPGYMLILLAPIAVYLLFEALLKTFGDPSFALPTDTFAEPARMIELTGRYKFMAAFAFFGACSVSVLLIFSLDLAANYTRRGVLTALAGIAAGAAVGIVLSILEPESLGEFETYALLGRDFFEAALGLGVTGYCADGPTCLDRSAFGMFRALSNAINALTSFALTAALAGMILSLARPRHDPAASAEARAAQMRAAQTVAQRYLYCAGLLLTAGITFLMAWMYWPADLIADEARRSAYRELVSAVTLYVGVGYSVLILSCYLPVMMIHIQRRDRLQTEMSETPQAAQPDLPAISPVKALNAIVAILSPILASAIGSFGQGILFQ